MSYFTPDEKTRLSFHPFPPGDAPIGYMEVSRTQLSIARHYGGITVQGHHYTYFPAHDELWRDDVLRLVEGWRNEKPEAAVQGWQQASMLDDAT
jgi:hypothetical protein